MDKIILVVTVVIAVAYIVKLNQTKKRLREEIEKKVAISKKDNVLLNMLAQWIKAKKNGKSVAEYCKKNSYNTIAIYGMGLIGDVLVEELANSGISIKYGIDRNAEDIYAEFPMVHPDDPLEKVDAVIVTAVTYFDVIGNMLIDRLDCPIISLEDIVYEM